MPGDNLLISCAESVDSWWISYTHVDKYGDKLCMSYPQLCIITIFTLIMWVSCV